MCKKQKRHAWSHKRSGVLQRRGALGRGLLHADVSHPEEMEMGMVCCKFDAVFLLLPSPRGPGKHLNVGHTQRNQQELDVTKSFLSRSVLAAVVTSYIPVTSFEVPRKIALPPCPHVTTFSTMESSVQTEVHSLDEHYHNVTRSKSPNVVLRVGINR